MGKKKLEVFSRDPLGVPHEYDCPQRLYGSYVCSCPGGRELKVTATRAQLSAYIADLEGEVDLYRARLTALAKDPPGYLGAGNAAQAILDAGAAYRAIKDGVE